MNKEIRQDGLSPGKKEKKRGKEKREGKRKETSQHLFFPQNHQFYTKGST